MERDEIRFPRDFVRVCPTEVFAAALVGFVPRGGKDLHIKCFGNVRDALSDFAEADNAERLACEFLQRRFPKAKIGAGSPFARVYRIAVYRYGIGESRDKLKDQLCHRARGIGGNITKRYAFLAQIGAVGNVKARGQQRDEF